MAELAAQFDLEAIQDAIRQQGVDGWLFAQFRGSDPIADVVLCRGAEAGLQTRRWFYYIPANGEPHALVHVIEPKALTGLPGLCQTYLPWQQLEQAIGNLLTGAQRVAMQYSPNNRLPYVSTVDAGTVELVRSFGVEVVSSAGLVSLFTATLSDAQIESHRRAAHELPRIVKAAFRRVRDAVRAGTEITEYALQRFIVDQIRAAGFESDEHEPPIVGVNAHAADPHYCPGASNSAPIREGDWLLLDQWCRTPDVGSVWADITWCGFVGDRVPERHAEVFQVVRRARDSAVDLIRQRYAEGQPVAGCEADRAAREVIESAGYGGAFTHRTGHNITCELHGTGAHLDDLETQDTRELIRRSCFSVEPGIYLDDLGVRLEVNMLIPAEGLPEVSGEQQDEPIALLAQDAEI